LPGPEELDRAWILCTALGDHLAEDVQGQEAQDQALGRAIGTVMGRLVKTGLEEPVTYALHRAHRVRKVRQRRRQGPVLGRRFLAALLVLSGLPAVQVYMDAMDQALAP